MMLPDSQGSSAVGDPNSDAIRISPEVFAEFTRSIAVLSERVRHEDERAGHREQIIDRLHTENQELRHGLLQEALAPVRAGLYRLYDTVHRAAAHWQGPEPPPVEHVGALLEGVAEDVAEVLARTGAERIAVTPGDPYDMDLHRPIATEPVETDRDGLVVAVLTDGFAVGVRVLRKADVVVGKASIPTDSTATPDLRAEVGGERGDLRGQMRKNGADGGM